MWDSWVQSLGQEDPLEKEMATSSSILAWEIPWTEEPGRLQTMGLQKSWTRPSDNFNDNKKIVTIVFPSALIPATILGNFRVP